MMITFAAFYIELSNETMAGIHQRVASITVDDPFLYMRTMFASARWFHSDCRKVVLTDRNTDLPAALDAQVIRLDLDASQPMLARALAWRTFVQRASSHVVFLDSDILINGNLDPIFQQTFDVGLTYRLQDKWPINAGINFAHADSLPGAAGFHELWLEHFSSAYAKDGVWGGDQDALRDLVNEADFTRTDSFMHHQGGYDIMMLPCAHYNFSTEDETGMTGRYPTSSVLHFKGRRKANMRPYWDGTVEQNSPGEKRQG